MVVSLIGFFIDQFDDFKMVKLSGLIQNSYSESKLSASYSLLSELSYLTVPDETRSYKKYLP